MRVSMLLIFGLSYSYSSIAIPRIGYLVDMHYLDEDGKPICSRDSDTQTDIRLEMLEREGTMASVEEHTRKFQKTNSIFDIRGGGRKKTEKPVRIGWAGRRGCACTLIALPSTTTPTPETIKAPA